MFEIGGMVYAVYPFWLVIEIGGAGGCGGTGHSAARDPLLDDSKLVSRAVEALYPSSVT